ncbi:hypothetical protein L596_022871 [Steinernema carpocapsae]|uniref:Uncharacterized protein n=1 Tax=Steinernema carpocapsae TaxID=34508 RepID=A0A4U5MBR8_STECR|nr:hypothetical protein L596_022871 [Steinernema carpocapsae]
MTSSSKSRSQRVDLKWSLRTIVSTCRTGHKSCLADLDPQNIQQYETIWIQVRPKLYASELYGSIITSGFLRLATMDPRPNL